MNTHILLAKKLYESGEEIAAREKCLSLLNNEGTAAEAYLLLSQICFDKKEYKQSLQYLNEAKAKNLATTAHDYLLGLNHYALNDLTNAKRAFEKILNTDPGDTESLRNLGVILKKEGSAFEAVAYFCDALDIDPTDVLICQNLFDALEALIAEEQSIATLSDRVCPHLETALGSPDFDLNRYLRVVVALVFSADHILLANQNLQSFAPAEPIDLDADAWFIEVCRDVLLQRLMASNILALADIEHFMTQLRRCLLEVTSKSKGLLSHIPLEFCVAMSQQAFLTEYVYDEIETETNLIQELRDGLVSKISSGKPLEVVDQKIVALISAYMSMDEWLQEGALIPKEGALATLIKSQFQDKRDERELQDQITAHSKISDVTSIKVRAQYEENPFPRWSSLSHPSVSTVGNTLEALFPHYKPPDKLYDGCSILIAGCGTGQHPIREALRYPECQVTATDLSLRSLATAMRRSKEFKVSNIQFLQADILNLGEYPDQFDYISCSGVLHHMADPIAGWRALLAQLSSGGVIRISVYSKISRRYIAEVREWISEQELKPTKESIRQIRQLIFNFSKDDPRRHVLGYSDFYSLSGVRDLLFHVEEHTFSLEQISEAIDGFGLEFIGLQVPNTDTEQQFVELFPEDPDMQDLFKWHEFEKLYPDSFRSMYQFWCRKF